MSTQHELENDIKRDFFERRRLLTHEIDPSSPASTHLMHLINTRLDVYPDGNRRADISLEAARDMLRMV